MTYRTQPFGKTTSDFGSGAIEPIALVLCEPGRAASMY